MELKENEKLRAIIPALKFEEYSVLKQDIEKNGQKVPILTMKDGTIIDGYHRFRIVAELQREPIYTVLENVNTVEEAVELSFQLNFYRRHLNPWQKIKWARSIVVLQNQDHRTVGKKIGVEQSLISKADRVLTRTDFPEELKTQLETGDLGVNGAYKAVVAAEKYEVAKSNLKDEHQRFRERLEDKYDPLMFDPKEVSNAIREIDIELGIKRSESEFEKEVAPLMDKIERLAPKYPDRVSITETKEDGFGHMIVDFKYKLKGDNEDEE